MSLSDGGELAVAGHMEQEEPVVVDAILGQLPGGIVAIAEGVIESFEVMIAMGDEVHLPRSEILNLGDGGSLLDVGEIGEAENSFGHGGGDLGMSGLTVGLARKGAF